MGKEGGYFFFVMQMPPPLKGSLLSQKVREGEGGGRKFLQKRWRGIPVAASLLLPSPLAGVDKRKGGGPVFQRRISKARVEEGKASPLSSEV